MENNNNEKWKNIIIILLVVIIIMLTTLIVLVVTKKNNYESKEQVSDIEKANNTVDKNDDDFMNELIGEWGMCQENYGCHGIIVSKDDNNKFGFAPYQMWSDGGYAGTVENIENTDINKYTITVHFDAVDNMLTTIEEHTNKYVIDVSNINSNTIVVDDYSYKKITGDREEFFNSINNIN